MARLHIDLQCLCLLVPDPARNSVHALMPAVDGHHGEQHVVRMLHPSFVGQPEGRPMEGWALVLDDERSPANTSLSVPGFTPLPNLTTLSGGARVPRLLTTDLHPQGITARVTFRSGRVTATKDDPVGWTFDGKQPEVRLPHRLTWTLDDVPDQLTWTRLGGGSSTPNPPIRSLRELTPEAPGTYRILIEHAAASTVGRGPSLRYEEARSHFSALYAPLGIAHIHPGSPEDMRLLPSTDDEAGRPVLCKLGEAVIND